MQVTNLEDAIGKVHRHKRLFNLVVIPEKLDESSMICIAGKGISKEIPLDYFKRDWKVDETIDTGDFIDKMNSIDDETPASLIYSEYFEHDDGLKHAYLHFDDFTDDEMTRFPEWKISIYNKSDRMEKINPFTIIMSIDDNKIKEATAELEYINDIRADNEYIQFEDFQGFEFGLIKLLEKKYLRVV